MIGGGAAGYFAAISAIENVSSLRISIYEWIQNVFIHDAFPNGFIHD